MGISSRNASSWHDLGRGTSRRRDDVGAGIRSESCQNPRWNVLISLYRDGFTEAHLVPKVMEQWVCLLIVSSVSNNAEAYQLAYGQRNGDYAEIEDPPINKDKYNIFTLRGDLYLIFDRGAFVLFQSPAKCECTS